MKCCVLGTGTWGTALAQLLIDNGHDVIQYGIDDAEVRDINDNHQNTKYFGTDLYLPITLKATTDLKLSLIDAKVIIVAVPTFAVRDVLKQIKPYLTDKPYIVSVAKGFDPTTGERMTEVFRDEIDSSLRQEVVSLIGPGHAEEVILRLLTCVTSTSQDLKAAKFIQSIFSNDYFRVYTQNDEIGAELGVALKNAIAIAGGMIEGIGLGDNAKAALVTRGLAEMVKFGTYFGGKKETYFGLTGLGDLMVTCNSPHSRNFQAGFAIGKANSATEFLKNNTKTVEGIRTAKVVYEVCKKHNIEMPIVEAVYNILYKNKKPSDELKLLMRRALKDESE